MTTAGVEVTCLGLCPDSHCLLIDVVDGPRVLVDCPLEPLGMKNFPVSCQTGPVSVLGGGHIGNVHTAVLSVVDPATIDLVVITNFHNMLALPYLTESAAGFRGIVLATEPTAEFGKHCMVEFAEFIAATSFGSSPATPGEWRTTEGGIDLGQGRQAYTRAQILSCMEKVVRLNYMQSTPVLGGFTCTPWAAGYSIGSANWTLSSATYNIAIIGASTISPLLRHPLPMHMQHLQHFDVAIIGDLLPRHRTHDQLQLAPPVRSLSGGPQHGVAVGWPSLGRILAAVKTTVQDGGNVLLPISLGSTSIDIIEALGLY